MEITSSVSEMHSDHSEWISKVKFYEEELDLISETIDEHVGHSSGKEVLALGEQLQNRILIQKENFDRIKHGIRHHETAIKRFLADDTDLQDPAMSEQHKQFGEELSYLEKEFQNLKNQIHQFILHKN